MDNTVFCEKKYLVTNTIQELYDEYTRNLEVSNQYKCENELEKKSLILTIKKQEGEIKNRDNTINRLEEDNSKKNKQISEYEKMIRDLEDKMNELLIEKEEENRFDMIRNQSNTIQEKENEIIRLTNLLKKKEDKTDKKIVNVLDSLNCNKEEIEIEENIEISVKKQEIKKATDPDEKDIIYGENAHEIASDRMIAHILEKEKEENLIAIKNYESFHNLPQGTATLDDVINSSAGIDGWFKYIKEEEDIYGLNKKEISEEEKSEQEESDEEDYECLTYRNKQYWIITGENPQYVYEIVGKDKDEVGDKLGVYKKTAGGKMKVFLDKK